MNIIQVQERLKDVSDDQLQQMMQQPGAMAPEFLVMAELNRRKRMREGYEAAQAQNDTTVAQDLLAAPGIPQAVGNQMAAAMRPEGAQTRAGIAGMAGGGIVGLQGGGFPPIPVPKPDYVATAPEQAGGFPPLPVPKPDYVAMTPEEAEIKQSITDFVEGLQAQYGADVGTGTETGALDDTDRRFMEALGITDPGKGVTFLPMSDVRVGQRLGSNGMQDFGAALDPLFRLGYDQNRIAYANDISGPGDLTSLLAYSPQGYSDPGVTFPSDTVLSSPGFDQARPALAHEFRHRGLQKLADKYSGSPNEALAGEITPYKNVYRSNISDLSRVLRAAAPGRDFNRSLEEAFIESYDSPQDVIPYPPEVRYSPFVTMADTIDHPEVRRAFLGRDATRGGSGHSEREYVNYLAAKMLSDQRAQKYEEAFGRPIPPEMLNDYRVNELGLPPVGAKRFGLFSTDYIESFKPRNYAEGGIVQAYKDGGAVGKGIDGVSYPTPLPQMKPEGIGYRVSEPSAMDLERLRQFEEKYGSIPEATAPTQDRQSWSDWFFGLINPRSDAQKERDAYVPTVESSNMFGTYAEGGIVQAYDDGGILSGLNQEYTPGEIAAMLRAPGASAPLDPSGVAMPAPLALPPLPPSLPAPRTPAPRRPGVLAGIANAIGTAASGGGMNYGISPSAGDIIPNLNIPPVDVGALGQSLANQAYYRQGKELGLTPQQTSEALSRGVPIEGLGQYKLDFAADPIELSPAPLTPPAAPTPPTPVVTPTAKTMPTAPAVDTTPIPTAPSAALPATPTPAMPSAPKTPAEAYTMTKVLEGAPAGDAASREARRNAFMALAKFGLTLAGSKEATAGGAIAEAGLGALGAYEAGAADIRNRALAAQKEAYQRQKDQMAMKQALSKEEYQRYRDLVRDAQIAAERGDNQAWRQAQLKLDEWKTRVAEQRAQATAEAGIASAVLKAQKEREDALRKELERISSPAAQMAVSQLPKAQKEAALGQQRLYATYLGNELQRLSGYSGLGQAPMPGTADLTK